MCHHSKQIFFSVQSATSRGSRVTFDQDNAVLSCNGTEFNIVKQGKLYYLNSVCDFVTLEMLLIH